MASVNKAIFSGAAERPRTETRGQGQFPRMMTCRSKVGRNSPVHAGRGN